MNKLIQNFKAIALSLAAVVLIASCQKSDEGMIPEKPVLPPQESMEMNMELVDNGNSTSRLQSYNAIYKAKFVTTFWTGLAALHTIVPKAAFEAVINHGEATYDEERSAWVWFVEYKVGLKNYQAELVGEQKDDHVHWEMWVVPQGEEAFLWFDGQTAVDASWAKWNLKKDKTSQNTYLIIEGEKNEAAGTWDLKYTATENQSYIAFGVNPDDAYDAYYDIFYVSDNGNELFKIRWNRDTKEGFIEGDNSPKECWNTEFVDVACE